MKQLHCGHVASSVLCPILDRGVEPVIVGHLVGALDIFLVNRD